MLTRKKARTPSTSTPSKRDHLRLFLPKNFIVEQTVYTFQEHFTAFPTGRKLKRVEHTLGILFNITSEMTSYIPTCWKQSFVLLNITFKILHISRALFSFAHRWKTRIMCWKFCKLFLKHLHNVKH